MDIDPAALDPATRYKLLIGSIVPRPIAFVSTISPDGRTNLAPFSFFCGVGSNPMTLAFCPVNNTDGSEKDTLANCKPREEGGTGQFVVNIASERYEKLVALAAEPLRRGDTEFDLTGLTPAPGVKVAPPRVAESPISFECETMQVIRTNPGAVGGGNVVLGRVVHVHVADEAAGEPPLLNDRFHVNADVLAAIGRMGGLAYCRTHDRFEMPMGRKVLRRE
jgi:flavin reductase (DIM6/NTAB) family NADH-FMN oxidoreductase RutF